MLNGQWFLQECVTSSEGSWFTLRFESDYGVRLQFRGQKDELEKLAEKIGGVSPAELPPISSEQFDNLWNLFPVG